MRSLFCVVLFLCTGCSATANSGPDQIRAKALIDHCVRALQSSGGVFDERIDRVYVLAAGKRFELMFTKGEFGTFGVRSENFGIGLHCHLTDNDSVKIDYLTEPPFKVYIRIDEVDSIMTTPLLKSVAVDMLYVKRGSEFEFSEMQKYNRDAALEAIRKKAAQSETTDGTALLQ